MATERITVTLPHEIVERLRREGREQRKPVSRLVTEALAAQEAERIRQRMIEGYKAMAEENQRLAEEWLPISVETWPDD